MITGNLIALLIHSGFAAPLKFTEKAIILYLAIKLIHPVKTGLGSIIVLSMP